MNPLGDNFSPENALEIIIETRKSCKIRIPCILTLGSLYTVNESCMECSGRISWEYLDMGEFPIWSGCFYCFLGSFLYIPDICIENFVDIGSIVVWDNPIDTGRPWIESIFTLHESHHLEGFDLESIILLNQVIVLYRIIRRIDIKFRESFFLENGDIFLENLRDTLGECASFSVSDDIPSLIHETSHIIGILDHEPISNLAEFFLAETGFFIRFKELSREEDSGCRKFEKEPCSSIHFLCPILVTIGHMKSVDHHRSGYFDRIFRFYFHPILFRSFEFFGDIDILSVHFEMDKRCVVSHSLDHPHPSIFGHSTRDISALLEEICHIINNRNFFHDLEFLLIDNDIPIHSVHIGDTFIIVRESLQDRMVLTEDTTKIFWLDSRELVWCSIDPESSLDSSDGCLYLIFVGEESTEISTICLRLTELPHKSRRIIGTKCSHKWFHLPWIVSNSLEDLLLQICKSFLQCLIFLRIKHVEEFFFSLHIFCFCFLKFWQELFELLLCNLSFCCLGNLKFVRICEDLILSSDLLLDLADRCNGRIISSKRLENIAPREDGFIFRRIKEGKF